MYSLVSFPGYFSLWALAYFYGALETKFCKSFSFILMIFFFAYTSRKVQFLFYIDEDE